MSIGNPGDARLSKNERREAGREHARQLREAEKKKQRRNRVLIQSGLVVGTLAVITAVVLIIVSVNKPAGPGPLNMLSDGIVIGQNLEAVPTAAIKAGGTPVETVPAAGSTAKAIQIWVDYQCPICESFESTNGSQIEALVKAGTATIEIHPVAILDRASSTKYSTRAANAAGCVANYSPNQFFAFNAAMYVDQPAEGGAGRTDAEILAIAKSAGVQKSDSIADCIKDQRFASWATAATKRAVANPDLQGTQGFGTPTVLVNGKQYTGSVSDAAAFAAFVTAS